MGVDGPDSLWNGTPYRGETEESTGVCCPVRHERTLEREPAALSTNVWDSERPPIEGGQTGDEDTYSSG